MSKKIIDQINNKGITLIALVVTIVVLLILAGVSITVLWGEHGIFGTAQNATTKFGIEAEREKINNVLIDWWTKKVTGENVTVEDFFKMLEPEIITNREEQVIGPDNNNNYIIETNDGYTVEIIIDDDGKITIGDIEKGSLGPKIKSLKVLETTANSIKVKAEFLRAENATINYYYKLSSAEEKESSYIAMNQNETKDEAIATGLVEGIEYDVKIVVTKEGFETQERKIKNIIARDVIFVTEITLNKSNTTIGLGKTTQLIATITPENATIKDLDWESNNEAVATVDANGKITTKEVGTASITAKAKDGSEKQATCIVKVIVATGKFNEEKGVNEPNLLEGMRAVVWDETAKDGQGDWVTPTNIDEWYDYSVETKKWANAMTEDGSLWVWIPRYAYQISSNYHKGETGTINIKFLKGVTNTAADGKTTWDNASGEGKWNIHPAFDYGMDIAGIWVAKFEASQSDAGQTSTTGTSGILKIQPGVSSWRSISISQMYDICLNYNENANSHLMKNSEWGAVAYLTESSYGKNSNIERNDSNSYYTGGGSGNAFKNKKGQSTTGNVYGIYDISGGAREYTAAYLECEKTKEDESIYTTEYAKALIDGEDYTKDVYVLEENTTLEAVTQNIYGDAIYEVTTKVSIGGSTWHDSQTSYPNTKSPFFVRGGMHDSVGAGAYNMVSSGGGAKETSISFRPVLSIF